MNITGFSDVWIIGPFVMTMQEALGQFGTVVVYDSGDKSLTSYILDWEF
jgi:hypothetical protein